MKEETKSSRIAPMSRINVKKRKQAIKIRHKRRQKLAKLRKAYIVAKSGEVKEKIWEKVRKLSPRLSQEVFLGKVKPKPASKKKEK